MSGVCWTPAWSPGAGSARRARFTRSMSSGSARTRSATSVALIARWDVVAGLRQRRGRAVVAARRRSSASAPAASRPAPASPQGGGRSGSSSDASVGASSAPVPAPTASGLGDGHGCRRSRFRRRLRERCGRHRRSGDDRSRRRRCGSVRRSRRRFGRGGLWRRWFVRGGRLHTLRRLETCCVGRHEQVPAGTDPVRVGETSTVGLRSTVVEVGDLTPPQRVAQVVGSDGPEAVPVPVRRRRDDVHLLRCGGNRGRHQAHGRRRLARRRRLGRWYPSPDLRGRHGERHRRCSQRHRRCGGQDRHRGDQPRRYLLDASDSRQADRRPTAQHRRGFDQHADREGEPCRPGNRLQDGHGQDTVVRLGECPADARERRDVRRPGRS